MYWVYKATCPLAKDQHNKIANVNTTTWTPQIEGGFTIPYLSLVKSTHPCMPAAGGRFLIAMERDGKKKIATRQLSTSLAIFLYGGTICFGGAAPKPSVEILGVLH